MRTNVSYPRPLAAKLVVQLENGEVFDATDADVAQFGFVDPHQVTGRFNDWLREVHPEVAALTDSPLNVFRHAVECAAHYPDMPGGDEVATARQILAAALTLHLVSEHALAMIADDPFEVHQHEHDGPGTIRNHDRDATDFDPQKVRRVLDEGQEPHI